MLNAVCLGARSSAACAATRTCVQNQARRASEKRDLLARPEEVEMDSGGQNAGARILIGP